jgi:cation-transporting ATPase 13A1
MALGTMSEEERLSSDSDFKPNLVNSVCYLVEQVGGLTAAAGFCK